MTQRFTGGEIVLERLIAEDVPYFVGIPGHGCLALMDAASTRTDQIQVRQEQSAIHMADGYYRVAGKPLACFTSIGPGALNCAIGLGAAYVDSTAMLLVSGEAHTYMAGRGVLQELERKRPADLPSVLEPLTKTAYRPTSPTELADSLSDAFVQMGSGRPGPTFVSLPMDVQADAADVDIAPTQIPVEAFLAAEPSQVTAAARLLRQAMRPVIVIGGGVTLANAEGELLRLAEKTGVPVVATLQAKGAFPEDHPLYAWLLGSKGTSVGNAVTTTADVVLAVGCRFTDQTASSFRAGATFTIPPQKLIHVDRDQQEIGKNYRVEIGITADAKATLSAIADEFGEAVDWEASDYFKDLVKYREQWLSEVADLRDSEMAPPDQPP
jgi:acetolactate synthase-1/2/3 large subunit